MSTGVTAAITRMMGRRSKQPQTQHWPVTGAHAVACAPVRGNGGGPPAAPSTSRHSPNQPGTLTRWQSARTHAHARTHTQAHSHTHTQTHTHTHTHTHTNTHTHTHTQRHTNTHADRHTQIHHVQRRRCFLMALVLKCVWGGCEQIRKTQAEPQWIVAQRLLSALTIPGFT